MLLRCRRQVHRRVPVEEAVRAQHESDLVYRHDGPILRAGDMRVPERIPHDQIGVGDGPVCCGPHRQSVAACALVGVVSRGITLITPIRRHPQVLLEKSRPLDHGRVVISERQASVPRASALTISIAASTSLPVSGSSGCNVAALCRDFMPRRMDEESRKIKHDTGLGPHRSLTL